MRTIGRESMSCSGFDRVHDAQLERVEHDERADRIDPGEVDERLDDAPGPCRGADCRASRA